MFKPELLSPAGSLDKLKVAVSYGADAVYLAGQKFGLRAAAENFTYDELDEGVAFAHARGVKCYVVLNGFLHDSDLAELPEFVGKLSELKIDAVIASDLGVITTVKKHSQIPVHLSTQASCLNLYSAKAWKKHGVQRLIFGREISIRDAGKIKKETGLEVELFIHGSMCMAYSGNCTISNFTQGRDSNRGGCAQSCRFKYSLETDQGIMAEDTAFMSSKDLNGLQVLGEFFEHEIDSLKIEGRMRSPLYAAMISRVYREAIDTFSEKRMLPAEQVAQWEQELKMLPHRRYTSASLLEPASLDSINDHPDDASRTEPHFLGMVRYVQPDQFAMVEVRASFNDGDPLEVISLRGENLQVKPGLKSSVGLPISKAPQSALVRLPWTAGMAAGQILRMSR